jgi:hypothetical protein
VFWFVKQPSWQTARACGATAKQASASAKTSAATVPQRRDERFIKFLVSEIFVFIKQTFLSPRFG